VLVTLSAPLDTPLLKGAGGMPYPKNTPLDFWKRVEKSDGCWLWFGFTDKDGYGIFEQNHVRFRAHRYAYQIGVGPIADGLSVCHSCDNPRCVRPSHLFVGSNKDNLRDAARKHRTAKQKVTHCPHGHEYTQENTAILRVDRNKGYGPTRKCRTCMRRQASVRRSRQRLARDGKS
jgi:hypothetical protein